MMKVKFNRAALAEAMALVTSVVPSRTPKPILQCVQLSCKDSTVSISGTDLEAGISLQVAQVQVEAPGELVVPADKLYSIIRESVDEVLLIEAHESSVSIIGGDSKFTIYSHLPSQYPQVPDFTGKADITVGLDRLQAGIEKTIFAAAKESTRYAINGVLWELDGKKINLVSTDGRRLAKAVVEMDAPVSKDIASNRVIVPTKVLALLDRVAADADADVKIQFTDNKIVMACGDVVISSNLVEGNFPKYEDIIPSDSDKKVTLSTAQILSAVKRAALLTNEDSKGIKLALDKDQLIFTSRAPETGDAEIKLTVEYSGSAIEIGFNPTFLIDVLRVINDSEFTFELGQSDRPGLIRSSQDFVYVVMPVSLS